MIIYFTRFTIQIRHKTNKHDQFEQFNYFRKSQREKKNTFFFVSYWFFYASFANKHGHDFDFPVDGLGRNLTNEPPT